MENMLQILSMKRGESHVLIIEMILQMMANNIMY